MTYQHERRASQSGFSLNGMCLPPLAYQGVSKRINSLTNISREIHNTANTTAKIQFKTNHQSQPTAQDYLGAVFVLNAYFNDNS